MRFYDRQNEISKLVEIGELSKTSARFTIVTGRRRIGKTSLLMKAYEDEPALYFFVSRDSESELCREFTNELREKMQVPILGNVERFSELFSYIMELSKSRPLTLIIDEFQNFMRVNPAIFSQMQRIWDLNKGESRLNLIVCGSVFSLMNRLFRDSKEPLYGRQTDFMHVGPFAPSVLREILLDNNPKAENEDLLALYLFSGGVAKYVELLMENGATTKMKMLHHVLAKDSYFIQEGKNMLIEEFGRDYGRYFEILKLIANGRNTRAEIEDTLKTEVSGYLTRLETDYALITKHRPILQSSTNKNIRYAIGDIFLRFWFRFIYKYNYIIETNAFDKLLSIVERDYDTFSGHTLEQYFREKMMETGNFTRIGSWWDRNGENEIDIIAVDDLKSAIEFYEIKRNKREINFDVLKEKSERFFEKTGEYGKYTVKYQGLSIEDM